MTQAEIAHRLDRRARAHEAACRAAGEVIEHRGRAVLEHLHAAQERAGIKVIFAHVAQRRPVIGAPNLQRLARHHAAHEIRRRVAVRIHHAGQRNHAAGVDNFVEGPVRRPLGRTGKNDAVAVDNDAGFIDNIVLLVHGDKQRIANQCSHSVLTFRKAKDKVQEHPHRDS